MKLKIRTKVLLGILFLFVEFALIGGLSIYYISSIKYSSELMIKNNYWSVHYSENMIQAIDETPEAVNSLFLNKKHLYDKNSLTASLNKFEENLGSDLKYLYLLRKKIIDETGNNTMLKEQNFEEILNPKIEEILKKINNK